MDLKKTKQTNKKQKAQKGIDTKWLKYILVGAKHMKLKKWVKTHWASPIQMPVSKNEF